MLAPGGDGEGGGAVAAAGASMLPPESNQRSLKKAKGKTSIWFSYSIISIAMFRLQQRSVAIGSCGIMVKGQVVEDSADGTVLNKPKKKTKETQTKNTNARKTYLS